MNEPKTIEDIFLQNNTMLKMILKEQAVLYQMIEETRLLVQNHVFGTEKSKQYEKESYARRNRYANALYDKKMYETAEACKAANKVFQEYMRKFREEWEQQQKSR